MSNQTLSWLPKSKLGKYSVSLIIMIFLLFIIGTSFTSSFYRSIPAGDTILEDIKTRPALAVSMLAGMLAGISSFFTGLTAIIKKKEKAVLVYISTAIGIFLLFFLLGELIYPH